jgi:hypothetical protein
VKVPAPFDRKANIALSIAGWLNRGEALDYQPILGAIVEARFPALKEEGTTKAGAKGAKAFNPAALA